MQDSPISKIVLDGREFSVKRDDLIDPYLAGNKYRKLYLLLETPPQKYNTILSYGGTQSNAMLALAALCKKKGWKFLYYTKPLSQTQQEQRNGNFTTALSLGMEHHEVAEPLYKEYIASLRLGLDEKVCLVDQGGADTMAKVGMDILAQEIREQKACGFISSDIKALATPSGTGTTALFLALAMPEYKVYTTPAIGSVAYLKEQMTALDVIPSNLVILPPRKKYHFAKPYREFLEIYKKLLESSIEFDLLYAPGMWQALLDNGINNLLYIHSGGVSGNESMLARYSQKGWI